ncbi:MAG TPA: DUF1501 domain-containing protein [Bauldia sp.]|nr:DUF1501 domain-containing protein [Bauldia sp.]
MSRNIYQNCEGQALISRRALLQATAILSFAALPELALAKSVSDTRLLTILLRGGLDGMFALPPTGDRQLASLRPKINPDETMKLDGFFSLHPAFKNVHDMYGRGEALLVHGASLPYTGRSHFEGQNIMETGVMVPYAVKTGWMGRALEAQGYASVAMSLPAPLILRSHARADNFYPSWLTAPPPRLYDRVLPLWAADPSLAAVEAQIQSERATPAAPSQLHVGDRNSLNLLAAEAGRRLKRGEGPRMAVLDHVGFDTHANEPSDNGKVFGEVDAAIGAFRQTIGDEVWKDTLIVTVTEFGRTAAENGSRGTDHGWGTAIFVLGGKLKKGGVVADWPGLKSNALFEGRDLRASIDARELYGTLLSTVLELDPERIRKDVFDYQPKGTFDAYL